MLLVLLALFLGSSDAGTVSCKTVADCWLDDGGGAIARPAKFRGRQLPRGDCGANILWLRNRLSCEQQLCVAVHVGDKC